MNFYGPFHGLVTRVLQTPLRTTGLDNNEKCLQMMALLHQDFFIR